MSYTIHYKKCNIKLSDNTIIPFSLAGSNNCYDANRNGSSGRRSRDWESSNYFCNAKDTPKESRKISATEEEIRENIRQYIEYTYLQKARSTDEYDRGFREQFKSFPEFLEASALYWFSEKIPGGTIKSMLSYFSTPTVTIQELLHFLSSISLGKYEEGKFLFEHANSEAELIEKMNLGYRIHDTEASMDRALKSIRDSKPTTPKIKKTQDFAFVLLYGGSQVVSYRGGSFKFTSYGRGKRFKTEALAQKVMDQLQKNTNARQSFEIKCIEESFTF